MASIAGSATLKINVTVHGKVVAQKFRVTDWSFTYADANGKQATFRIQLFTPGTEVLREVVQHATKIANKGNSGARRDLGLHALGTIINSDAVLNGRLISERDISKAFPAGSAAADFALAVQQSAARSKSTDLESWLVESMTGFAPKKLGAHLRAIDRLVEEAVRQHQLAYRTVRSSDAAYSRGAKPKVETRDLHRAREALRRRCGESKEAMVAAAFHYANEGDRLVDEANRLSLGALRQSGKATRAELRAFSFLFLRRAKPCGAVSKLPWFSGIIGYQPFLMSLLARAPQSWARLALTLFSDVPVNDGRNQLRRELVGLLSTGKYVLEQTREHERLQMKSRRSERPPVERANLAQISALRVDRADLAITEAEKVVVEALAHGTTPTELAKTLGISRQAVMNRLARAGERSPHPPKAQARRKAPEEESDDDSPDENSVEAFLAKKRRGGR